VSSTHALRGLRHRNFGLFFAGPPHLGGRHVPLGASMMVQMASLNTFIQSMVPDELRGRVMAAYTMMG